MASTSKLQGIDGRKLTDQPVPVCPECDHVHKEINQNPEFECPNCGNVFNAIESTTTETLEHIECGGCDHGRFLYSIPETQTIVDCISCGNILMVQHRGETFEPMTVMEAACDDTGFVIPEEGLELIAANILAKFGYNDDVSFRPFDADQFTYMLKCSDGIPCGYLSWNTPPSLGIPLLNQIWVLEEYRRNGHAQSLVEKWCRDCVDGDGMIFVESPSADGKALFDYLSDSDGRLFGREWDVYHS